MATLKKSGRQTATRGPMVISRGILELDVSPRFCETDMNGHVSHTAIAPWLEQGRFAWLEAEDIKGLRLVVARIEFDFRREMRYGFDVVVRTQLLSVGNTSLSLSQDILQDEDVCVQARVVLVNVDSTSKKPRKIETASSA